MKKDKIGAEFDFTEQPFGVWTLDFKVNLKDADLRLLDRRLPGLRDADLRPPDLRDADPNSAIGN